MSRQRAPSRGDVDALLDKYQTADLLSVKPKTLEAWRRKGSGPAYIRISATCVRYRREDIVAWINARRHGGEFSAPTGALG